MKMFITVATTVILIVSMTAFIFSFNACLSSQASVVINDTATKNADSDLTYDPKEEAVYDKAELIVFNADGDVVYNEIVPSI